jgi:tetratricopeptide (TPR) repeat protein
MATKQPKIDRHELKEADQFFETVGVVNRYVSENRTQVITATAGAVAVFLSLVAGVAWVHSASEGAADQFARALNSLEFDSPTAAEVGFEGVQGRSFAGTYGALATLMRAGIAADTARWDDSVKLYDEFAGQAPTDYLEQAALVAKAFALDEAGKDVEAAKAYEQAADMDGPYRAEALERRAELAEASGNKQAARNAIEKLLELDPAGVDTERWSNTLEKLRGA